MSGGSGASEKSCRLSPPGVLSVSLDKSSMTSSSHFGLVGADVLSASSADCRISRFGCVPTSARYDRKFELIGRS